ncbi:MAG: hypothetical protein JNL72_07260 [Flavipsychrobacter sp.]|nr:hypothetical protein [Flavipsychrobacter sp.]
MQRIEMLLQKISELSAKGEKNTAIDIDLMLDYVKVVYADLLEWRGRVVFTHSLPASGRTAATPQPAQVPEPVAENTPPAVAEPEPIHEAPAPQPEPSKPEPIVEAPAPPVVQYVPPQTYDIRNNIGINDKYLFMSELFGNDREAYEKALDAINKCDSYSEALEWMNEHVLFVNEGDANDENNTGQLFYDTISSFFSER